MTIAQGVLAPRSVLAGAWLSLGGGVLAGLLLLAREGPALWASPLLWIGIGGVVVAVSYTAGPWPLSRMGLGEVAAGVFMGPLMVLGAWYVQAGCIDRGPALASLPLALMVAAILHANNLRDMEADRAVGKRTLAVAFRVARGASGICAAGVGLLCSAAAAGGGGSNSLAGIAGAGDTAGGDSVAAGSAGHNRCRAAARGAGRYGAAARADGAAAGAGLDTGGGGRNRQRRRFLRRMKHGRLSAGRGNAVDLLYTAEC